MMQMIKPLTLWLFLILLVIRANQAFAYPELKMVNIGNHQTIGGDVIKNCQVAYRTVGTLNANKSNVVLWPTWFGGTSEDLFTNNILTNVLDTTGLYIVVVDALSNGVSSSPSNTKHFPQITIGDMVNAQHKLLVDHLGINHLYAVAGISMGGMQAFEWLVSYPQFMDKVISIVGTPKQSAYDMLVWQTQADLLTHAGTDKKQLDFAIKKSYDILHMNLTTPTGFALSHAANEVQQFMAQKYQNMMDAADYLAGVKAMMQHNIFKKPHHDISNINNLIKADVLVIVEQSDHLVNPLNAMALAKALNSKPLVLTGNNGHMAAFIQTNEILAATSAFLQ